jgi:DNA-binding response OmpR family regulator
LQGRYAVVADDDRANLDGLVQALSDAGCIAEGADSLAEARRLFAGRDRCPDILLADFLLGGEETGLDIVAALRERFEWATATPVLFVSGDPGIAAKLGGFQGVHALHRKPVKADALLAQMQALLEPPRNLP